MKVDELIREVDIERLYHHVMELEGPRDALDTPHKLNQSADYILFTKFPQIPYLLVLPNFRLDHVFFF